jgi:hypothetical protein
VFHGSDLLRQAWLNLDNFTLEPVTLAQDLFSATPTIQGPPTQFLAERHSRELGTATGCMLKIVPLMTMTIFEESPVEMIVDALGRIARGHLMPPITRSQAVEVL